MCLRSLVQTFILGLCLVVAGRAQAAPPDAIAIEHVTVLPMTVRGTRLADQTVTIVGGRISAIGPSASARVPETARRIDGRGKWLMPALADMHVHMPNDRMVVAVGRMFTGGATLRGPSIRQADAILPYVATGVLQVMNMSAMAEDVGLRHDIETGEMLGPHLALALMVDGNPTIYPIGMSRPATTPDNGRQIVRDAKIDSYDFIKPYSGLDLDTFRAILDEADKQGMKAVGHLPMRGKGMVDKLLPGYAAVAHAEEFAFQTEAMSDADIVRYVDLAKRNGNWLTSSLITLETIVQQMRDPESLKGNPEHAYVHPMFNYIWTDANPYLKSRSPERIALLSRAVDFNRRLVRAFVRAGIPVMAGTDTMIPGIVPGYALHKELSFLAEAGMTNAQALEAATRLPAEWLGTIADRGTVEVGKRADLLVLSADPLSDIANTQKIAAVIRDGRYLSRAELDTMLKQLAARYAAMPKPIAEPPKNEAQ